MKNKARGWNQEDVLDYNKNIPKLLFAAGISMLICIGGLGILWQDNTVNASPIIIDENSYGYWEDNFEDSSGLETWDNVKLGNKGIELINHTNISENFTGVNGSSPNSIFWDLIDEGYTLEIQSNMLKSSANPPPSTWVYEMIQTKDLLGGNHTLTWTQQIHTVAGGMYVHFFVINASDESRLFAFNQNSIGQYNLVNYITTTNIVLGTGISGWYDYKVTFDEGLMVFYYDGVKRHEYNFNISYVKYQFGTYVIDTSATIYTDNITIKSTSTTGNITSTEITLPRDKTWESVIVDKTENGIDNIISISVIDSITHQPIFGFENMSGTNIDISAIDIGIHPKIHLRGYIASNGTATPILHGWKVTWFDTISPITPRGLGIVDPLTGYSLILTWNSNSEYDLDCYVLYYSTNNVTFQWLINVSEDTISFIHYGLNVGTTYYYKIAAADEVPNQSPFSEIVQGIPDIDIDNDGIGNMVDEDDDNDGIPDISDPYPLSNIHDIEAAIDSINNSIVDISNIIISLQSDLDYVNAELNHLETQLFYLAENLSVLNESLSNEILKVVDKIDAINNSMTDISNNIFSLQSDLDYVNAELNHLETQLFYLAENLSVLNESLSNEILKIIDKIDALERNSTQNLSDVLTELQSLAQALQNMNEELQNSMDDIKTDVEDKSKEIELEERIKFVEILLIIVFVLLVINLILMLILDKRKRHSNLEKLNEEFKKENKEELPPPPPPES